MATAVYTGTHTVVGKTADGTKVVFSKFVGDRAGTSGVYGVRVTPLKRIDSFWAGVRSPGVTATTFEIVAGKDTSELSGANMIYFTQLAQTSTSGAQIDVISFGV
jgi:hypothetical protein